MEKRKNVESSIHPKKKQRIERKKEKIKAFLKLINIDENDNQEQKSGSAVETPNRMPKVVQQMSDEELQKLRVKLKARQKAAMERPKIYTCLDHAVLSCDICPGEQKTVRETSMSVDDFFSSLQDSQHLFPVDLQHFILYALEGNITSYKPRWCKLLRQSKVSQFVVLEMLGVSKQMFLSSQHCLSAVKDLNFNVCVKMISPHQYGGTFLSEIRDVTSGDLLKNIEQKDKNNQDYFGRLSLLLSPKQMVMEGYPLPVDLDDVKDYVFTKNQYTKVTPDSPMFAIDCEMCLTSGQQLELTRIAVVNEKLDTVYETLVKPDRKIINYMTKFSGIVESMLESVTVRLEDVHARIRKILPSDAILCGQSLCGDLKAMKMFHPYVIDTSVIYNLSGLRYKKPGLKLLSAKFLNKTIQNDPSGHSPLEDATATMQLVQLKLKEGFYFGDVISGWSSSSHHSEPNNDKPVIGVPDPCNIKTKDQMNETAELPAFDSSKYQDELSAPPGKVAKTQSHASTKNDTIPIVDHERSVDNSIQEHSQEPNVKKLDPDSLNNCQKLFFSEVKQRTRRTIFSVAKRVKRKISVIAGETTAESCRHDCDSDPADFITVMSNKECYRATKTALNGTDFMIWSQFSNEIMPDDDVGVEKHMKQINKWVKKLAKKCKPNALFILLFAGDEKHSSHSNAVCLVKII